MTGKFEAKNKKKTFYLCHSCAHITARENSSTIFVVLLFCCAITKNERESRGKNDFGWILGDKKSLLGAEV